MTISSHEFIVPWNGPETLEFDFLSSTHGSGSL